LWHLRLFSFARFRRCTGRAHALLIRHQLWTKPLSTNSTAALLFNAGNTSQAAGFTMRELGLNCDTGHVRDVWTDAVVNGVAAVNVTVERHDSAAYICSCQQ
jgi:hypothetical protein